MQRAKAMISYFIYYWHVVFVLCLYLAKFAKYSKSV